MKTDKDLPDQVEVPFTLVGRVTSLETRVSELEDGLTALALMDKVIINAVENLFEAFDAIQKDLPHGINVNALPAVQELRKAMVK